MRKRFVVAVATVLVVIGIYVARPVGDRHVSMPAVQPATTEKPPADREQQPEHSTSADAPFESAALAPELPPVEELPDSNSADVSEEAIPNDTLPSQPLKLENVAEQAQLALERGYIDESELPEFHRQHEERNSLIQAQQEAEMSELVEGDVSQ